MRKLISSSEALDILSRSAPRTWCKRLLLQLIFEGHLFAFFREGHWRGLLPITVLLDTDELAPTDGDRFWSAVAKRWGSIAPKGPEGLVRGRDGVSLAPVTGGRWYADSTHSEHQVGFGYFHYADTVDFEAGTLTIDEFRPFEAIEEFFPSDDDMFRYKELWGEALFSWFVCKVELGEMAFEGRAIELIAGMESSTGKSVLAPKGRTTKWDWAGAMMAVVKLANSPDGISQARGEQARVEEVMSDWFIRTAGDQPHLSQVRAYAARLMDYLAENGSLSD